MSDAEETRIRQALQRAWRYRDQGEMVTGQTPSPLVGFAGRKRAGKDTAAQLLIDRGFAVQNIGRSINAMLEVLNPFVGSISGTDVRYSRLVADIGYEEAKEIPEVRRLQQTMGVEVMRDMVAPGVWVNMAKREIEDHRDAGRGVAATSIRFPNEAAMIREMGGILVWVERPDTVSSRPDILTAIEEAIAGHRSEMALTEVDCDITILNDGTVEQLHERLAAVMEALEWGQAERVGRTS